MNKEKTKRMDSPQRLQDFKLDEILSIMDIKGHETVIDVGSGPGLFSVQIAKQLDSGHLFAYDVDTEVLAVLKAKITDQNIANITPVEITDDIVLEKADKIFICAVFHEIADKDAFLSMYKDQLNENGKLYIVEFTSGKRRLSEKIPPKREFISMSDAKQLLEGHFDSVEVAKLNELVYIAVCSV